MLDIQEISKGIPRHDFSREEIQEIYNLPIPKLIHLAQEVHQKYFKPDEVQISTLLSIKTGGCKENCAYCPQSAHHQTELEAHGLLNVEQIKRLHRRQRTVVLAVSVWVLLGEAS